MALLAFVCRALSTTVNVFFNANDGAFSYCDEYSCTVTGYMNEYVEGTTSLSLCQVEAGGAVIHDNVPFASSGHIPLTFNIPEVGAWNPVPSEEVEVERFAAMAFFVLTLWFQTGRRFLLFFVCRPSMGR